MTFWALRRRRRCERMRPFSIKVHGHQMWKWLWPMLLVLLGLKILVTMMGAWSFGVITPIYVAARFYGEPTMAEGIPLLVCLGIAVISWPVCYLGMLFGKRERRLFAIGLIVLCGMDAVFCCMSAMDGGMPAVKLAGALENFGLMILLFAEIMWRRRWQMDRQATKYG